MVVFQPQPPLVGRPGDRGDGVSSPLAVGPSTAQSIFPPSGYGWSTPHPESCRACLSHSPMNERKRIRRCECLPAEQKPGPHGNKTALVTSLGLSVHNHQASPYRGRHGCPAALQGPRLSPSCKKGQPGPAQVLQEACMQGGLCHHPLWAHLLLLYLFLSRSGTRGQLPFSLSSFLKSTIENHNKNDTNSSQVLPQAERFSPCP